MTSKSEKSFPKQRNGQQCVLILLFSFSLVFLLLAKILPRGSVEKQRAEMLKASQIMSDAEAVLRACLSEKGLTVVEEHDINGTGIIGLEWSPMTTSIGNLEAKRTTTNPNMAALVVYLLREAGVRRGDPVAVGGSGSFPALIIAVMSAAKAMDIEPLIISSLGASQWGANRPEFHFFDMLECLRTVGIFDVRPVAASLGGERDIGEGMSPEARAQLIKDIVDSGIPFVLEEELAANVQKKMQIYEARAGEKGISCFINIGGNWSNMGTDSEILNLKPGLAKIKNIPPPQERGLVFEMASREIPVLHLLYIKGLIERYGLPWDPSPLPKAGLGSVYDKPIEDQPLFVFLGGLYLLGIALIAFLYVCLKRKDRMNF
jgi:poly-gamma-glutamate system protein